MSYNLRLVGSVISSDFKPAGENQPSASLSMEKKLKTDLTF